MQPGPPQGYLVGTRLSEAIPFSNHKTLDRASPGARAILDWSQRSVAAKQGFQPSYNAQHLSYEWHIA